MSALAVWQIKKHYFFILLAIAILNHWAYAQNNLYLRNTIKNLLVEQDISGAVWAVVSEKGEIITDATGYKNRKTRDFLNPKDKVHVGSVSKTILSAGFLRLATLGLINLHDPVIKYLPDLPVINPWEITDPVTIKHLLDHTSGLADAMLWHIFSTTAKPDTPLETFYLRSPKILRVQVKPGSIYSYSNLGYTILGMIIEKVTQQRYEKYLDEEVLKPLEMTSSSFHFISQSTDSQLAYGHFDNGEPVIALPMYLRPAGQFTTTAEDIGKFLRFLMSDGTINGNQFIKPEYLTSIGKQESTDACKNGVPFGDALGMYSRDRYGVLGLAKNGNTLGFSAMIYLFPNEKKAFFVAYNTDSESADYDLFNETIVKSLNLRHHPFVSSEQNTDSEISNWKGYYVPVVTKVEPFGLLDYVFSHTKVEITKTGAKLMPVQGKNRLLTYQGKRLFSMPDRTNISHAFYKSTDGNLLITDGVKTIKKVSGLKIFAISSSILLGISGLIYLFVTGFMSFIKHKFNYRSQPVIWVFIPLLMMFISFIFIAHQPFMSLGDMTFGNVLLAVSTFLLPLGSSVSLVASLKKSKRYLYTSGFWATFLILQFCILLGVNNLMPIIMWK